MGLILEKRQYVGGSDGGYWYYSSTSLAIKWGILAAIVAVIFLFFILGYAHSRRRMRKGLPPLAYHRWFTPRPQPAGFATQADPQQPNAYYAHQDPDEHGYYMHSMPPPAYNPNFAPPPVYQPPTGASKFDPSQQAPGLPAYPAPTADPGQMPAGGMYGSSGATTNPFR
ncbi:MAG: hypothetical protein M1826_001957 [Phylliscum demangeonii]|nr:MAG: hypothetical protein M1826_001957 [Phylliscum demangeonii]